MKPFPYSLNIGTDIVHLPRISRLLRQRPNYLEKFSRRILCESEREDFRRRFSMSDMNNTNKNQNRNRNRSNNDNGLQFMINTSFGEQSSDSKSKIKSENEYTTTTTTTTESQPESITQTTDITRWLAGRFAAKEAARKAAPLGAASLGWKDVLVRVPQPQLRSQPPSGVRDGNGNSTSNTHSNTDMKTGHGHGGGEGRPEIVYLGQDRENTRYSHGQDVIECSDYERHGQVGKLSISHDGEYVIATVLAVG